MIIKLTESKLFTKDPAIRFSNQYNVPLNLWKELWKRYKLLGYDVPELCEVFLIKTGNKINNEAMGDWLFKGEIYMMTNDKVKMGVQAVTSEFFGELEQRVLNEILHHVKYSNVKKPRNMA